MKKIKSILMLAVLFIVLALPHVADAADMPAFVNLLTSYPNSANYITQLKKLTVTYYWHDETGNFFVYEFVKNNADKTVTVYNKHDVINVNGDVVRSYPREIEEIWHLDENGMVSSIMVKGYTGQSHYVYYEGDSVIVYEGWQGGSEYKIGKNGSYTYKMEYSAPPEREYEYDSLERVISSEDIHGNNYISYLESQIEYYDSVPKVYSFDVKNISNPVNPKEGKANVNQVQWTGDVFEFTAITAPEVNEISLIADKFEGIEWHEITCDYLQRNFFLEAHINSNNQKVWTCRFGIHNAGERIFKLKADGIDTGITTTLNVIPQQEEIDVTVNGNHINFDVPPQIINDRTMIPVRAVTEALNARFVEWDEKKRMVGIRLPNKNGGEDTFMELTIDSDRMYVFTVMYEEETARYITLDSPAIIVDGRTLIPLRALAEATGYTVEWDETTKTVSIY